MPSAVAEIAHLPQLRLRPLVTATRLTVVGILVCRVVSRFWNLFAYQTTLVSVAVSFTDWLVFGLCMLVTLLLVLYGHLRRTNTGMLDYLLMGRQLTLPMYVATLTATWYGGIFGVTQLAFQHGLYSFLTQGIFWYATYIIFALIFIKRIRAYQAMTLPQLVTQMFGKYAGKLSSLFNFLNVLPIVYATSLGLFLHSLTGWGFFLCTLLGLLSVSCYAVVGGFRAVVYSDIGQFFFMYLAVICVLFFSFAEYGGISFLRAQLPASFFSLNADIPVLTTLVWGFIALSTLVDPNFYQRIFAARSPQIAKNGILLATAIWVTFDLCTVLGAMYARAVMPQLPASNAYLLYAMQLLPAGFGGLLLAGICATILSTMDSYLHIASTSLSYDLCGYQRPNATIPHMASLTITALITLCLTYLFDQKIPLIWKTLGTYSASCLLLPVVWGLFLPPRTIKDSHFVCICLSSALAVTLWKILPHKFNLEELYVGVAVSTLGLCLSFVFSSKQLHRK